MDDIKYIKLAYGTGFFSSYHFEEEIEISIDSISYKRKYNKLPPNSSLKDYSWSYKSSSRNFSKEYIRLCDALNRYKQVNKEKVLDGDIFSIDIYYLSGEHKELLFQGRSKLDGELQYIKYLIRRLTPSIEDVPYCVKEQELEEVNVEELHKYIDLVKSAKEVDFEHGCPKWIHNLFFGLVEMDYSYDKTLSLECGFNDNYDKYQFKEIKAFLTLIIREEHFGYEEIKRHVFDGSLLKVLNRLDELIKDLEPTNND